MKCATRRSTHGCSASITLIDACRCDTSSGPKTASSCACAAWGRSSVQHDPSDIALAARLARAARRAESDPFFLGYALAQYRQACQLGDEGVAAFLNCSPADLVSLALCRMPSPVDPRFHADVERIA